MNSPADPELIPLAHRVLSAFRARRVAVSSAPRCSFSTH